MKVLILLAYYNRPQMVRFALESIKMQSYKNWELAFCDDGSDMPGKSIVKEILADDLDKVKFFNTYDTVEDKVRFGGSRHGMMLNEAMNNSDADIALILCDDDGLYHNALENLANYYKNNPDKNYSYGHISMYNPKEYANPREVGENLNFASNPLVRNHFNHTGDINPSCVVDASQVSWRLPQAKEKNIIFMYPQTTNLDASFYDSLYNAFGSCSYNNVIVQFKGIFDNQMGNRVNSYEVGDN